MDDVAAQVVAMIATQKGIAPEAITPESTFDDLQVDSLDKINLTFEVEERYDIAIPDDSLSTLRTVSDVVAGVHRLLAAKGSAAAPAEDKGKETA